jgi:hypothetical protein
MHSSLGAAAALVAASAADVASHAPWLHRVLLGFALYVPVGPWFAAALLWGRAAEGSAQGGVGWFFLWGLRHADGRVVYTLDTWAVALWDWAAVHLPTLLYIVLRHGRAARPLRWRLAWSLPPTVGWMHAYVLVPAALSVYVWVAWASFAWGAVQLAVVYGPWAALVSPAKAWWAAFLFLALLHQPRAPASA